MTDEAEPKKEYVRTIESEMKRAFIDYSMSVIMSRALPDVRDGLKPVHRRILYAMNDMGMLDTSPYRSSFQVQHLLYQSPIHCRMCMSIACSLGVSGIVL